MLESLYKYAQDNELVAVPGFVPKNVRHYICFSVSGVFLGFETLEKDAEKIMCPDIGSLANGKTKSNIIAEKAAVILNLPDEKTGEYKYAEKQKFYFEALSEASQHDSSFVPAVNGLKDYYDRILSAFEADKKLKSGDVMSIKVDGKPLESSHGYREWWESFRKSFETKKTGKRKRCFITGELTEPKMTVPPVQGLASVGGHTKGDSFICFDKDAFRSYGLEKAYNAAVSEEAVTGMNAALLELMKAAPRLAGAKNIHWFSQKPEYDVFDTLDTGLDLDLGFEPDPEDQQLRFETLKTEDERKVRDLFAFMMNKSRPEMPENRYYMMSLSGVNGRVMIRSYDEGTYDSLCNNIRAWFDDIAIYEKGYGYRYPKLFGIYSRMLKFSNDNRKLGERIDAELSGLSSQIMNCILHNTALPDSVASKVLMYIRSDLYSRTSDDSKRSRINIDLTASRILKAWLNRKYRKEKKEEYLIMDKLNENSPSKAYQTGRLMAIYAAIQRKALGDVGAGVVERYYTSACTAPALVIGKLATASQYHLSKLENKDKIFYSRLLQEIGCKIGTSLPKTFSLEEQSQFALGYYFQNSEMYTKSTVTEE